MMLVITERLFLWVVSAVIILLLLLGAGPLPVHFVSVLCSVRRGGGAVVGGLSVL